MGLAATRRAFGALVAIAIALLPALVQPVSAGAASTGTLFGITGMNRTTLSKIDLGTGAVTPIAQLGLPPNFNAQVTNLTGDPATHRLFALRISVIVQPPPGNFTMILELLTINGQTGSFTVSPPLSTPIGDLQFDSLSNTLFALVSAGFLGAHGVVRLDPTTGAVSAVASIGPPGPFIDSMVIAPQTHTAYVNREDVALPGGTNPSQIVTVNTATGTVSTSPVMSRPIRSISYDASSNRLFGVTDCCVQDLVQIDPSSGLQTFVANVSNSPNQGFMFYQAVDPLSHTVFLPFEFFATFPSESHIFSINTQTGASVLSPAIATGVASLYFETTTAPPDTSPPATSIGLSPAPNAAGWNNANVTVNLSATDPDGVADVATINYSATGAQTVGPTAVAGSSASFVVNTEGVTTASYFARDKAGNTEAAHTQVIRIDKTPPTITYTGNAGTYTVDQTVNITCTAQDPPNANGTAASGLASTTCVNVNAPAFTFPLGPNTLSASATDNAGNTGTGSTTFTIQVTNASVCTLTVRFIESSPNAPTSPALAEAQGNRLCKLLANAGSVPDPEAKNALVGAYQKGLTILVDMGLLTAAQAAILLTLSQAL
jgi:hypothetical protein